MRKLNLVFTVLAVAGLAACSRVPRASNLLDLEQNVRPIDWNKDELGRELAPRTWNEPDKASFHYMRLTESEKPHVHDRHDLTLFVLQGEALTHIDGKSLRVGPGDVVEIPKGKTHWAETIDGQNCVVYAVFNPPFDGKDRRPVAAS